MKTAFAVLSIIHILFSCNYDKYKNRIQGKKGTFWDVSKRNSVRFNPPVNAYYFEVNGNCTYYSMRRLPDGKFNRVPEHSGKTPVNTWRMKNDTLELLGDKYWIHSRTPQKLNLIPLDEANDTLELLQSDW